MLRMLEDIKLVSTGIRLFFVCYMSRLTILHEREVTSIEHEGEILKCECKSIQHHCFFLGIVIRAGVHVLSWLVVNHLDRLLVGTHRSGTTDSEKTHWVSLSPIVSLRYRSPFKLSTAS